MKCFSFSREKQVLAVKGTWLSIIVALTSTTPPPNKRANGKPLPLVWTNDFVPPSVAASQLPERRRQGHWCLSLAAPRHIVVYSISSPHLWYLNHKGERFISLLGEEGGSCLSERACWIKGVISPEGGIWEWVSLRQHSLSHCLCLCMLPGSPSFDFFPSPPLSLLHHVILSFLLSLPLHFLRLIYIRFLPSRRAPFLLPLLVQRRSTGNGELRCSQDGCYSNHTSNGARVQ